MERERNVLPFIATRTEGVVRHALARDLSRLCHEHGPQELGLRVGCDERTIRNARDEGATLKLHTAFNLLSVDPTALDGLLAEYGLRAVPCDSVDAARHATPIMARASAATAEMTDPDSLGGTEIVDKELLANETAIRDSHRLTGWMLARIDRVRNIGLRRVA